MIVLFFCLIFILVVFLYSIAKSEKSNSIESSNFNNGGGNNNFSKLKSEISETSEKIVENNLNNNIQKKLEIKDTSSKEEIVHRIKEISKLKRETFYIEDNILENSSYNLPKAIVRDLLSKHIITKKNKKYDNGYSFSNIKISIYKILGNGNYKFYIKDNICINTIPDEINDICSSVHFGNSILFFKEFELISVIRVEDYNEPCSTYDRNGIVVYMQNLGQKTIKINKVSSFYICETNKLNKAEIKVYNGYYNLKLPLNLEKTYTIIEQLDINRNNRTYYLLLIKNAQITHYVENVVDYYKKINNNGELLCKVNYNKNDYEQKDEILLYLRNDGEIETNYKLSKKYKSMFDYINSQEGKRNLDFVFIDKNGFVNIYYYEIESINFYILNEFTQNADFKEKIENKFDDDISTVNYLVKYKQDRIFDIAFIAFILDQRHGAQSAFDNGLYGTDFKSNFFAGTAIYNIPFLDYYKGLEGEFSYLNYTSQIYLKPEQKNNYKYYVKEIWEKYGNIVDFETLPNEFIKDSIAADVMLDKLEKFIQSNTTIKIDYVKHKIYDNNSDFVFDLKTKKEEIVQKLAQQNVGISRWKNELQLYNLVLKKYPNAIYQYREKFLGKQSFDIYIPDIRVAIEYQGIQHYKSIDFFGGEDGYLMRQNLDKQKRAICKRENIKLIEWKYDIPINTLNIEKYISEIIKTEC